MNNKPYTSKRLHDYALWYYFRYYPSNARLLQKLKEKGSEEDAQKIFTNIKHLLQEDEIIKAKIDNYIFRHKNYRYIRQKMREKLFPSEAVEQYLEKYLNSWKSLLTKEFLRKKIENFIQRGKSRQYIFQKLWETPEDKELLNWLLEDYFANWESENIRKEYEKIRTKLQNQTTHPKAPLFQNRGELTFTWKQKITQKLLSKWFKYNEVKKVLEL